MARTVSRRGGVTTTLNVEGLEKYIKDLQYLSSGDILMRAATYVQQQAFLAMKRKYFQTKSNRIYYNKKYLSKGKDKSIESRLFNSRLPSPVRKGEYTISFKFWPGYTELKRSLPHLRWQEEGIGASIDIQPYIVRGPRSLGPITKRKARNRPKVERRDYSSGEVYNRINFGATVDVSVPHPSLKARGFIAAGNLYLKTQGQKDFSDFIKNELRKRNA